MSGIFRRKQIFSAQPVNNVPTYSVPSIIGDGLLFTVPVGYMLEFIIVKETNSGTVTIQIGTSGGDSDIVPGTVIAADSTTVFDIGVMFDASQQIFISDTGGGWGTAEIDVYVLTRRVI